MEFTIEKLDELMKSHDGNHSLLYHHMEDRILKHIENSDLPDGYEGFLENFLCFETEYIRVLKDMLVNNIDGPVLDIGAQCGFQSEFFLEKGYVGIEYYQDTMFNEDKDNVSYILETFPSPNIDLQNQVVISNMSVSFFNHFITEDKTVDVDQITLDELAKARILYFRGELEYTEKLKKRFKNHELLYHDPLKMTQYHQWKFWN